MAIKNIVILGGGFAGLRIAYLINKKGYNVSLIEKSRNLGGMVQTFKHEFQGDKYLFDFGPHLFFEDFIYEYRGLIGNDLLNLTDRFCMYTKNTILSYPLRPIEFITKMNPMLSLLYIINSIIHWSIPDFTGKRDTNLKGYMVKRFGKKLFEDFFSPYIEKCCGLSPDQISILWAKERENVSGTSLINNIINKLRAQLNKEIKKRLAKFNDPSTQLISSLYPKQGAGQLCDVMAATLCNQNIYLNTTIEKINIVDYSVKNIIITKGGSRESITGDYFISTLPLPKLFEYFNPILPNRIESAKKLLFRNIRLVNLIINKDRILDSLEMFSMNRDHLFKRIYEPKAMSSIMAPKGKTSLSLEICHNIDDVISNMTNEKIINKCINDLLDINLLDSIKDVLDSFIIEIPYAYPIYSIGIDIHRQKLLDEIFKFNNLLTSGRQGLFRYHAMTNEIMEMADEVVGFFEGDPDKNLRKRTLKWGHLFY